MNKKLIRKMLTASGGPIRRIKFTPEQIALFESQTTRVLGMNNSGGDRYRKEGILALQHLEQEAKRKEEEIKSRMEMRPTLKNRKVTTAEKLQGKKDEYELKPLVVGMSGKDPLLGTLFDLYVGGKGLEAAGKLGLWGAAKYAPGTLLGNWGRGYFVGNAFKNSFNGTVPTLTSLLASKNLFRTKVYKGGEIEDPYSNFLTTDPKYAANYGKISPYIFESKSIAKAKEPMMGSSDPVTMDMFVYNNTKGNPNATAIIGHDAITGEFTPSKGVEIYSMSPANLFKINNSEKGRIFTGFKELQRLLDMMNNSHSAPHPPIYERVSYSKYSADAANPKERDLVILHFKARYPNSGLQVISPLKISGFTYDNLLKVGELPLSEEGKAIADVMARRMKNYKLREGLDPNIVHFGQNRFSRSGINGMMNQIKNDKTIAYMPLKNSDNYGGLYEGGEALLKLNPWREKPYIYSLIHEGVSHMTDDFVKDLRTPLSEKKLLDDVARNFNGTKSSNSMYGRISYPSDIYDEKLIEKILHKDSMKPIESRSMNWEMITNLYKMLSKEKGISYKLATELPDSEFGAFVEKILDSPEKLSKFMEKFDNQYLLDYSNLMKAGTKELANKFYKRIKGMLKYGPSLITGGYFLTSQKQGGKMNIIEFLKKGSGIYIKPSKRGSFTRWCGGNVTEECIRRGKNSPNAAIRKKATFADNARHFKHKKGGKAFVEGVNVLDSNPKMSKAASRRVKKHLYGGDINNPNAMGGTAFTSWINYQMRLPELLKLREEKKQQELQLEQLKLIEKSEKLNSILGTVSNFGYLALGKLLNNKPASKVDNGTPSKTNFWNTPTIKNSQVTGDFWNTPTIANSIA